MPGSGRLYLVPGVDAEGLSDLHGLGSAGAEGGVVIVAGEDSRGSPLEDGFEEGIVYWKWAVVEGCVSRRGVTQPDPGCAGLRFQPRSLGEQGGGVGVGITPVEGGNDEWLPVDVHEA